MSNVPRKPRKDRKNPQEPLKFVWDVTVEVECSAALGQAEHAESIARKIEDGEALSATDRMIVALVLRKEAERLRTLKPKRKRGAPRRFDPGWAALEMALRLKNGSAQTKTEAWSQVAEAIGVSDEAVERAKTMEDEAMALVFGVSIEEIERAKTMADEAIGLVFKG